MKSNKENTTSTNPFNANTESNITEYLSPKFNNLQGGAEENSDSSSNEEEEEKVQSSSSVLTFSNMQLEETTSDEKEEREKRQKHKMGTKLLLTGELFYNQKIIIDKDGMINGLRGKTDGQTFFGLINLKDYSGTYYNDLVLNYHNKEMNNSATGRVFDISFQKRTNDYRLYMIHNSLIIYYEIESVFYLEEDKLYNMLLGRVELVMTTRKNEHKKFIDIQVWVENGAEENHTFSEDELPITIGRVASSLTIQNPSVSKKHGVLDYSTECEAFYYKDLGSTNSSVLLIKEDDTLRIKGDMKFRLGDIQFRILELP